MLEPTKKHPTEIELRFVGPGNKKQDAIKALRELGFVTHDNDSAAVSWLDHFSGLDENESGTYLSGARHREGMTQKQLAEKTGVPQRHISEMENGKRPIGKKIAKVFAKILKTNYRVFL